MAANKLPAAVAELVQRNTPKTPSPPLVQEEKRVAFQPDAGAWKNGPPSGKLHKSPAAAQPIPVNAIMPKLGALSVSSVGAPAATVSRTALGGSVADSKNTKRNKGKRSTISTSSDSDENDKIVASINAGLGLDVIEEEHKASYSDSFVPSRSYAKTKGKKEKIVAPVNQYVGRKKLASLPSHMLANYKELNDSVEKARTDHFLWDFTLNEASDRYNIVVTPKTDGRVITNNEFDVVESGRGVWPDESAEVVPEALPVPSDLKTLLWG